MTLITAILLTVYKKFNNRKGYKIPKLKFAQELEILIFKDIVIKFGGSPEKINEILNSREGFEHLWQDGRACGATY